MTPAYIQGLKDMHTVLSKALGVSITNSDGPAAYRQALLEACTHLGRAIEAIEAPGATDEKGG